MFIGAMIVSALIVIVGLTVLLLSIYHQLERIEDIESNNELFSNSSITDFMKLNLDFIRQEPHLLYVYNSIKNKSEIKIEIFKNFIYYDLNKTDRKINLITNILPIVGLLGTFLGIIIGISSFGSDYETQKIMLSLIDSAKFGFITSLIALFTTIIIRIIWSLVKSEIVRRIHDVETIFSTMFLPKTYISKFDNRLISSVENLEVALGNFLLDYREENKAFIESKYETTAMSIDRIESIMSLINNTIINFTKSFTEINDKHLRKYEDILINQKQEFTTIFGDLNKLNQGMDENSSLALKNNIVSNNNLTAIDSLLPEIENILQSSNLFHSRTDQTLNSMLKLDNTLESFVKSAKSLENMVDIPNYVENIDKLVGNLGKYFNEISDVSIRTIDAKIAFDDITRITTKIMEDYSNHSIQFSSELTQNLEKFEKNIYDLFGFIKSQENVSVNIVNTDEITKLLKLSRDDNHLIENYENLNKKISNQLVKLEENIRDVVSNKHTSEDKVSSPDTTKNKGIMGHLFGKRL